ncbi:MAG: MarR family transcriptional regulator [Alphaproteobacteria bacterium]|nr:MarR family transcriptional regulator [Alphaproteobacteria bacterium]
MSLAPVDPPKELQRLGRLAAGAEPGHNLGEPRFWSERVGAPGRVALGVRFRSFEAGAKLLSAKNRILLRTIAERKPQSVAALAAMTGRSEQNLLRTLNKLVDAGIVRLNRGDGRARRPVLAVRKIHVEIDLLAG